MKKDVEAYLLGASDHMMVVVDVNVVADAGLGTNSTVGDPADQDFTVTFVHINDHHSHFDEQSFALLKEAIPSGLSVDADGIVVYYGGAPRVAFTIKELSSQAEERGHEVIKVHAGDAMTGTLFYSLFGPEPDAAFMNEVDFDAFVIGNHE